MPQALKMEHFDYGKLRYAEICYFSKSKVYINSTLILVQQIEHKIFFMNI